MPRLVGDVAGAAGSGARMASRGRARPEHRLRAGPGSQPASPDEDQRA